MQAKSFLIINTLIIVILVVRLLMARKVPRPTPLNLDKPLYPAKPMAQKPPEAVDPMASSNPTGERTLNCYFQFNEMMLDAFEILGVPGGADRESCYRAYVDLRRRMSNPEVIEVAWGALEKHFSRR
jgi:hypothetical protein